MTQLHKKNSRETVKNTSVFSFFTVISRFLGLARDALKAYAFGTSLFAVAFDIAFRLPNMLRNLVAEGALSHSFLPIYESSKDPQNPMAEREASGVVIALMATGLVLLTLAAWLLLPVLLPSLIHEMQGRAGAVELTVKLAQFLFPYIIFMSLTSIYMSIQYSHGVFWSGAIGPALLNVVILFVFGGYLFFPGVTHEGDFLVYLFAAVNLGAAAIQLVFQALVVRRMKLSPRFSLRWRHPAVKSLFIMMLPASLGAAAQEIGQLIDIFLATWISSVVPGAVAALTYSHRLIHLPMGVFGIAISTAALPQFSRLFKEERHEEFIESIWSAIKLNFFLILPAILGLTLFAGPIVGLLFERGEFDAESTRITAEALRYYAAGILGFSLQKLFLSSMYARHNSRIPALITIGVLVFNISLSLIFMQYIYHAGLALASSVAGYGGALVYLYLLRRHGYFKISVQKVKQSLKIIAANVILAGVLIGYRHLAGVWQLGYAIELSGAVVLAVALYMALSALLKIQEFFLFKELLMARLKR